MKPQRRPKEQIDKLPDLPIEIKRYDPTHKKKANIYREELNRLLAPFKVTAELAGSVELEIATKGEWEYAVYLTDEQWFAVLVFLINHFRSIHYLSEDMAVFTTASDGVEVEIFPVRNEAAQRNRGIMDYWRGNPAALQEYEQGKLQHAYSKREYYRWKDEHFAKIVETL